MSTQRAIRLLSKPSLGFFTLFHRLYSGVDVGCLSACSVVGQVGLHLHCFRMRMRMVYLAECAFERGWLPQLGLLSAVVFQRAPKLTCSC